MSRYSREGTPPPEPTFTWRTKVIVALVGVVLVLLGITAYYAIKDGAKIKSEPHAAEPAGDLWSHSEAEYRPPVAPPENDRNQVFAAADSGNTNETTAADPPPDPFATARSSKVGITSANNPELDGTTFPGGSSSGGCRLKAGTVIIADQVNATTNTNPGAVIAQVAFDVSGEDGCDGIRAGSTFVGGVEQGAGFGAERSNYVFQTLEPVGKPPVDLELAASDAMGRGGVPGEVDHHTGKIATRVAIASIVDIASAGASFIANPFMSAPVQNSGRAVDNWANQAINTAPTLTTDPLKRRSRMTIILMKAIDV